MKLTAHFYSDEFACRCGCGFDAINRDLVDGLQVLRHIIDAPIHVISGCRCPQHNDSVGGAKNSQHVRGMAADIMSPAFTPRTLYEQVKRVPRFTGIGVSDEAGFVHVDIREKPAKWCYRHGKEVGWFEVDGK